MEPRSPASSQLQVDSLLLSHQGNSKVPWVLTNAQCHISFIIVSYRIVSPYKNSIACYPWSAKTIHVNYLYSYAFPIISHNWNLLVYRLFWQPFKLWNMHLGVSMFFLDLTAHFSMLNNILWYGCTEGEKVEAVRDFISLGSKITVDGDCSHEIKTCLLLRRKVMTNLDSTLKAETLFCRQRSI